MNAPGRKWLTHELPSWVNPDASNYFITMNCQTRGTNQLCVPSVGEALLTAARTYYELRKLFPFVFLAMPDHIHMLVSFGREQGMMEVIAGCKRYTARQHGIIWQPNFFEHRLRQEESMEEKAGYILQNPVRAGLVQQSAAWLHVSMLDPSGAQIST